MSIGEKLTKIAENEQKVYEAGELSAIKSEAIWKAIQRPNASGDYASVKENCSYMFFNFDTKYFYPKYNIAPTKAYQFTRNMTGDVIDLVERLAECGVSMDFSNCTNVTYVFYQCKFSHLPILDFSKAGSSTQYMLFGRYVETIDKLILSESGQNCKNTFAYASALENIVIEGKIAAVSNVELSGCSKLTLASAKSILTALSDASGTDRAGLYAITLAPEVVALLEADGATAPNGLTWMEYVSAKGWLL